MKKALKKLAKFIKPCNNILYLYRRFWRLTLKNPFRKLSFKIILTVLIGTVISNIVIALVVCNGSSKALQQMMYEDLLHSVSAVAKDMNTNNQRELRMLQTLALNESLRNPDVSLEEKCKIAGNAVALDKHYIEVSLLDMSGNGIRKFRIIVTIGRSEASRWEQKNLLKILSSSILPKPPKVVRMVCPIIKVGLTKCSWISMSFLKRKMKK